MIIKYSKQFLKDIVGLSNKQTKQLKEPFHPQLNNHALKGKLKDYHSINITGDIRAIFKSETQKAASEITAKFVRLNTHSELYG